MNGVQLVEIRVDSDGGFVDFDLTMVSFRRGANGVQHVSARGLHEGQIVGFGVGLSSTWERQDLETALFRFTGVRLYSFRLARRATLFCGPWTKRTKPTLVTKRWVIEYRLSPWASTVTPF